MPLEVANKGISMYRWCKRHLNWTLGIGIIVIESPVFFNLLVMKDIQAVTWNWFFTWMIPTLVAEFTFEAWYLYQKKRSYLYLLLNFVKFPAMGEFRFPVGLIWMLALLNKRESQTSLTTDVEP